MIDRTFKAVDRYGAEMEFELIPPTLAIEHEGERQYRVAYSKALKVGIFPRNKLKEIMHEHGMWTDNDEKAMRETVASLAISQVELEHAQLDGNDAKCLKIAQSMQKNRMRMWELFMIQQSVYMNSAEGVSELIKAEVMMAACTVIKGTREKYWKTYEDFVRERDENNTSTVYINTVSVQSSLIMQIKDQIDEGNPEYKYLKDVKTRMLDRDIEEQVEAELQKRANEAIKKNTKKKAVRKKVTKKKTVKK